MANVDMSVTLEVAPQVSAGSPKRKHLVQPILSFCSTCMNREDQLKATLLRNLEVIAKYQGQVELVLVNFIRDDIGERIHQWVTGVVEPRVGFKYYTCAELHNWHASVAKNTAYKQASGDFIVNLDCDNYLCETIIEKLLSYERSERENIVFSGFSGGLTVKKIKKKPKWKATLQDFIYFLRQPEKIHPHRKPKWTRYTIVSLRDESGKDFNGTYGHVGMSKKAFFQIGGYDQSFPPMGGQDKDLIWRAYNLEGAELLHIPVPEDCWPEPNDKLESLRLTSAGSKEWADLSRQATSLAREKILQRNYVANKNAYIGLNVTRVF